MKVSAIFASLALTVFCFSANGSTPSNVAVYATEQSQGAISIGDKTAYTKTFEISLVKLSSDTVDLSNLCLKAYSPGKKEYKLDTIDEVLTTGSLKESKPVKGIAVFASENDDVLKATMVKISDDCK